MVNFLTIFGTRSIKTWKNWLIFSSFNPFPSMPSVATGNRKQFQCLQICMYVLITKLNNLITKLIISFGIQLMRRYLLVFYKVAKYHDDAPLRQNPKENRTISGFSGQKSGTRIILSILQSFLCFHCKQFPMGTRENKFQSSENLCKHRQNFTDQFHFTFFEYFIWSSTFVCDVWCC